MERGDETAAAAGARCKCYRARRGRQDRVSKRAARARLSPRPVFYPNAVRGIRTEATPARLTRLGHALSFLFSRMPI